MFYKIVHRYVALVDELPNEMVYLAQLATGGYDNMKSHAPFCRVYRRTQEHFLLSYN